MSESRVWTFGELAAQGDLEFGDGYRTRRAEHGRPGLPILRVGEILDGKIAPEFSDYVHKVYRPKMGNKVSEPGDVVLTTKGTVGRVALMPSESPEFVYSPQVCFFRTKARPRLLIRYLYYWFKSHEFWSQAAAIKAQTDMADYINLADIRRLYITVPPISAQKAVIDVLGALDDKIAVNERIAHGVLTLGSLWYERSCINAPNICEFRIGDIVDIFDGPHATPRKTSGGPWFLSISSLKRGHLDLSESAHISDEDFTRWTRRVTPQEGDLLFSYETRLGEAALMPPSIRGCLGRRMALMRPRQSRVASIFLLYSYLGTEFQETIRRRAIHGATVDRIPLAELPSWRIRILDSDEHRPLANFLSALHNKMVLSQRENDTLRELRDTLLPKLLGRKLRIKEAESVVKEAV